MGLRAVFRFAAPTIMLGILLLLLGGVAAWYLHRLQQDSSETIRASSVKAAAAEQVEMLSYRLRNRVTDFIFSGDRRELAGIPALHAEVDRALRQIREHAQTPRERQLIERIEKGYRGFFVELDEVSKDLDWSRHRDQYLALGRRLTQREILEPTHEYRQLSRQQLAVAGQRDLAIANRMGLGLLSLGVSAGVAGLLLGFSIARGIHRSMMQLAVPIHDASGKLSQIVGPITIYSDPTFQNLEANLAQLAAQTGRVVDQLQKSHRATARAEQLAAVGQLGASLVHELRNPLTAIKVIVQTAAEEGAQARLDGRDVEVLEEEIARLDHIIQTFLDFARPPRPSKRRTVLQPLLEQTVELVMHRAEQSGIRIECRMPRHDVAAEVDDGQLRQLFLNLLLNALDASHEGHTIKVCMRQQRRSPDGPSGGRAEHWAIIEVADPGPGLPLELGEKIFEPFVSTKETGTGLGLPICRRIAADHGGTLTAANRLQGGTVFTLCIPLAPAAMSVPEQPPAAPPCQR